MYHDEKRREIAKGRTGWSFHPALVAAKEMLYRKQGLSCSSTTYSRSSKVARADVVSFCPDHYW